MKAAKTRKPTECAVGRKFIVDVFKVWYLSDPLTHQHYQHNLLMTVFVSVKVSEIDNSQSANVT